MRFFRKKPVKISVERVSLPPKAIICGKHGIQRAGSFAISGSHQDGVARNFCFKCFCEWIEESFGREQVNKTD